MPARSVIQRGLQGLAGHATVLAAFSVVALTVAVRSVGLLTAYDVYGDELIYRELGVSLAHGNFPPLDAQGQPFLVHPPGFLFLEATWVQVFGSGGNAFQQVTSLRGLQVLLAGASVLLLFLVIRETAGLLAAALGSVVFALDPYALRQNGRVLIETATMAFLLGGMYLILRMTRAQGNKAVPAVVAGGSLGLAALTKDMAAAVIALTLAALLVTASGPSRRIAVTLAGVSAIPYVCYVLAVCARGLGASLWAAKSTGVLRLAGKDVYTGYDVNGSPSLSRIVQSQFQQYGVSFVVVAVGVAGSAWLVVRARTQAQRVLAIFTLASAGIVGYGAVFGTIEDQFLYFVAVPAFASAVAAGRELLCRASSRRRRRALKTAIAVVMVVVTVLDGAVWLRTRTVPDDAQLRAAVWLREHARSSSTVGVVADQMQELLADGGVRAVPLPRPDSSTLR